MTLQVKMFGLLIFIVVFTVQFLREAQCHVKITQCIVNTRFF